MTGYSSLLYIAAQLLLYALLNFNTIKRATEKCKTKTSTLGRQPRNPSRVLASDVPLEMVRLELLLVMLEHAALDHLLEHIDFRG
jgi:hypothetical protein